VEILEDVNREELQVSGVRLDNRGVLGENSVVMDRGRCGPSRGLRGGTRRRQSGIMTLLRARGSDSKLSPTTHT
jgi:hypothetical protein